MVLRRAVVILALCVAACASGRGRRAPSAGDGGTGDSSLADAWVDGSRADALPMDGGGVDAGRDAGPADAGPTDGGRDSGSADSGAADAGPRDGGPSDAGVLDAGPRSCEELDCSSLARPCLDATCVESAGMPPTCQLVSRPDLEACGAWTECAQPRCESGVCVPNERDGLPCDDRDACTIGDRCAGATCVPGTGSTCGNGLCDCGESAASCAGDCGATGGLPTNACTSGAQSRDGCGSARVIGRSSALAGWSSGTQNTCSANDRHDDACPSFDVGADHTYALYVQAGERVTLTLETPPDRCAAGEDLTSFLKLKFNAATTSAGAQSCPSYVGCWAGPRRFDTYVYTRDYDATEDGWLFLIVDGGATAFDEDRGYYILGATLSRCAVAGCGC